MEETKQRMMEIRLRGSERRVRKKWDWRGNRRICEEIGEEEDTEKKETRREWWK